MATKALSSIPVDQKQLVDFSKKNLKDSETIKLAQKIYDKCVSGNALIYSNGKLELNLGTGAQISLYFSRITPGKENFTKKMQELVNQALPQLPKPTLTNKPKKTHPTATHRNSPSPLTDLTFKATPPPAHPSQKPPAQKPVGTTITQGDAQAAKRVRGMKANQAKALGDMIHLTTTQTKVTHTKGVSKERIEQVKDRYMYFFKREGNESWFNRDAIEVKPSADGGVTMIIPNSNFNIGKRTNKKLSAEDLKLIETLSRKDLDPQLRAKLEKQEAKLFS